MQANINPVLIFCVHDSAVVGVCVCVCVHVCIHDMVSFCGTYSSLFIIPNGDIV